MKFLGNYFGKKEEIEIAPKFKRMSKEELILTANTLKDANNNLKTSLEGLTTKNNSLKDIILNKEKKSSELKSFMKDMKNTLFSSSDIDNNEKNKELNDFIYDQYTLYGGLEEEEINDINQIKIKEDNWIDNKDFFILKQKIIERNYQELFKNILISEELNKLFFGEDINNNYNINVENNLKTNKPNDINNNKNKDIEKNNQKEDKKQKSKKRNNEKNKKDKEENKFNFDNLNKDKKMNYRLEDFNFLEEGDEKISLKDLSDEKKNKWDDDDNE